MKHLLIIILFCIPFSCVTAQTLDVSNIQWRFQDSTLYISGEGDLPKIPFINNIEIPWDSLKIEIAKLVITGKIMSIGRRFFVGGEYSNLRSVDMRSSSVKKIDSTAFICCRKLKEIYFSDSLKIIEYCAFDNTDLRRVVLPPYTQCHPSAFYNCFNLEYFSFPDSLRTTQEFDATKAFDDNFEVKLSPVTDTIAPFTIGTLNINHIDIPSSVRCIADSAFYYRYSKLRRRKVMERISFHFSEQQILSMSWGPRWAEGLKSDVVTFIVPKGLKSVYDAFINRKYDNNFVIMESDQ